MKTIKKLGLVSAVAFAMFALSACDDSSSASSDETSVSSSSVESSDSEESSSSVEKNHRETKPKTSRLVVLRAQSLSKYQVVP